MWWIQSRTTISHTLTYKQLIMSTYIYYLYTQIFKNHTHTTNNKHIHKEIKRKSGQGWGGAKMLAGK